MSWKSEKALRKAKKRALAQFKKSIAREGIVSKEATETLFRHRVLGAPAKGYSKNDGFYESGAWKSLRYEVLRDSGGVCGCCGASRATGALLHVDHIKPRYKFPELSLVKSNLQVLCSDCNLGKGAWDQTDFRPKKQLFKKTGGTVPID